MNSKSMTEIRASCKDFALIDPGNMQFISPLWLSVVSITEAIGETGATTDQVVERTGLHLNTVRGYLRELIAGGFPIRAEKQKISGAPYVFFVERGDIRWLK
jgi:hypothetical protein